jgi:single-stranded-DNA-specific exonuclease
MTLAPVRITRGLSGARWQLADCDQSALRQLQEETGEPAILLRCLLNRGITAGAEARQFLAPDFPSHLHPPALLRDMGKAVERLRRAVRERERVMIVTDFDVDGTTSSVILSNVMRLIGGGDLTTCYVPDRFTEGYGLSHQIVERAAAAGYRVIVTADIGIKSHDEARLARERGIDLIICDHHLPDGADVPAEAFAVLCPKGSSGTDYPNKHLAACGVALKLADALLDGSPRRAETLASLAKLTAIGSIADLVDLAASENRAIVAHGLRGLSQRSSNPGLRALLTVAQVGNPLTTYDVGFKIGPRINAAGRIAHANKVLDLFAASTDSEAMRLARQLDELNAERQQIQQALAAKVMAEVERKQADLEKVLLFAGTEKEGYHRGVAGIVCSKLVEMTGRPAFICSINDDGMAQGSARSIRGFHVVEALDTASELLVKYGGHPMAAGFTLAAEKIEALSLRLNRYAAERLRDEDLGRALTADAELELDQAGLATVRALRRLEPHGIGNPAPLLLLRRVPLRAVATLKDKHLKLRVGAPPHLLDALWWEAVKYQPQLAGARQVSLMCRLEINVWKGLESAQLKVEDLALE